MTRRCDTCTAERIEIALLMRDAFGLGAAITYALLKLIDSVFSRAEDKLLDYGSLPPPAYQIRRQHAKINTPDRRVCARSISPFGSRPILALHAGEIMGHHPSTSPRGFALESAYRLIWLQLEASHGQQFATAFLADFAPQIFSALERLPLLATSRSGSASPHIPYRKPS